MLDFIILQAEGATQSGGWSFWVMMLLICFVFYFFMIRPQTKKQKELQRQRDALKKGDKVVTASGVHGIIKEIEQSTFLIEIAKDVTIKIDKTSVFSVPVMSDGSERGQNTDKK